MYIFKDSNGNEIRVKKDPGLTQEEESRYLDFIKFFLTVYHIEVYRPQEVYRSLTLDQIVIKDMATNHEERISLPEYLGQLFLNLKLANGRFIKMASFIRGGKVQDQHVSHPSTLLPKANEAPPPPIKEDPNSRENSQVDEQKLSPTKTKLEQNISPKITSRIHNEPKGTSISKQTLKEILTSYDQEKGFFRKNFYFWSETRTIRNLRKIEEEAEKSQQDLISKESIQAVLAARDQRPWYLHIGRKTGLSSALGFFEQPNNTSHLLPKKELSATDRAIRKLSLAFNTR